MRRTHLCNHFHCDPIFTCPQAVHIAESVELARQFVDIARTDPDFRCILSEIDYLQGYWNVHVEERAEFTRLLRSSHIETSGSYSEPNENSVGAEALARNIVYGQWFLIDRLGGHGDVYLPFDVFGHVTQLPQLLRKAGFVGAIWTKGSPRGGRRAEEVAWWLAPDGSRILNRVASYGSVDWGARDQYDGVVAMAGRMTAHPATDQPEANIVFRGSDFVSPPWWIVGRASALAEHGIAVSQPSAYFADVRREIDAGRVLSVTGREMSQYHVGTSLSRSELKIGTRLAEQAVAEAEVWATIATLYGVPYPEPAIDHAWRQILFCQHHDSITGTSNDQSYVDLMSHLHEALAEGSAARDGALAALAGRVSCDAAGVDRSIVVFNGSAAARSDVVRVPVPDDAAGTAWEVADETGAARPTEIVDTPAGREIRFLAGDVPGIGHRTYHICRLAATLSADVVESDDAPVVIETARARVTFDPWRGGGITGLVDLASGREYAATGGNPLNDLVALREGPTVEPSWEFHTTGARHHASSHRAHVRAERTPLGWRVTIRHAFPDTDGVVRTVEAYDGIDRIDCTVEIASYAGSRLLGRDRQGLSGDALARDVDAEPEVRDLFGVLFPLSLRGVAPVWSDRFGQRVVRQSVGYLDYRTHQSQIESGCAMYSADQWVALSPNAAIVIADPRDVAPLGIPLGMVRVVFPDRPVFRDAAERLIAALLARGVTATPYHDTDDQNTDPLQTDQVIAIGGASANAWVAAQADWPADMARFLRDARPWGNSGRAAPALVINGADDAATAAEVDRVVAELASETVGIPADAAISAAIGPLDENGFAVLNRGTIAASAEPDGSIFLGLQHATGWCDWATPYYLGHPFVPERKTAVHQYALVPFAGNWRAARLPAVAEAFNRPLRAVSTTPHAGTVPPVHRWVAIDAAGTLVSALKPVGQPSAEFVDRILDAAEGAVVRLWNWNGVGEAVRVRPWTGARDAVACDLAERPGTKLAIDGDTALVPVAANGIETVRIVLNRPADGVAPAGNAPLPEDRITCRWWLHNAGAAPRGNLPVAVALRGDLVPGERGVVRLSIANNRLDRSLAGRVRISGPAAWKISPTAVPFSLALDAGEVREIAVDVPAGAPGRLRAELTDGSTTYEDTLAIGEVADPTLDVELDGDTIVATVGNPSDDPLDVRLMLVGPLETWPEADGYVRTPVAWRDNVIHITSHKQIKCSIPVPSGATAASWLFVKLAAANRTIYRRAPVRADAVVTAIPGAPMALDMPLADIALVVESDRAVTVSASAVRTTEPPATTDRSPLPTVRKYWTLSPVGNADALRAAAVSVGIVPGEIPSVARPENATIVRWLHGHWEAVPTAFDRRTWTLSAELPPASLRDFTRWSVAGPSLELWRWNSGGRFFEADPVAIDADRDGHVEIVVGTAWNEICMLSDRGHVKWRRRFGGWTWPSPAFAVADFDGDGRHEVVAAPSDRSLALVEPDGRIRWRRDDLPFSIKRRPLVADIDGDGRQEIVVAIHDDGVWAFRDDGTSLWRADLGPMRLSAPVLAPDGTILVNLAGKQLVALACDGTEIARQVFAEGAATARVVAEPVVTGAFGGEAILHGGHDGRLRCVDRAGAVRWDVDLGSPIAGAPGVIADEGVPPMIVACTVQGRVVGIAGDGSIRWEVATPGTIQARPTIADIDGDGRAEAIVGVSRAQKTYIIRRDGEIAAIVPYGAIWSHAVPVAPIGPAGRPALVIGNTDGHVVALDSAKMTD